MSPLELKAGALPTIPLLPAIIKGRGPEPVYFDQRVNSVSCQTFSKQGHYTWGWNESSFPLRTLEAQSVVDRAASWFPSCLSPTVGPLSS